MPKKHLLKFSNRGNIFVVGLKAPDDKYTRDEKIGRVKLSWSSLHLGKDLSVPK